MRAHTLPLAAALLRGAGTERRTPYDGLRPWSALTHALGALLALAGTALLLSAARGDPQKFWMFALYGASMVCLYTASTLYHCLRTGPAGRLALRKYDHSAIYLLIAGSYTPICLTALRGLGGEGLLFAIWFLAGAGVLLTIAKLDIPRWLTSLIYLVMGWLALTAIVPLSRALAPEGMFWLLSGGLFYTVGGVLYALKWPGRDNPRFGCHEIFHLFILLGSLCHFCLMYRVILPL